MPYTTRKLTVSLRDMAGEASEGVDVTITPHITAGLLPAVDEAAIAGFKASGVTGSTGVVEFDLIQSSDISPGLLYQAQIGDLDRRVSFHMPDNNDFLHDILSVAETGGFIDPFEIPESFLELVDTPIEYGDAGQLLAVAADGSSLIFVNSPDSTVHTSAPVTGTGASTSPITIPDGAIGNDQLALDSVTNTEIKDGTIQDDNIANDQITASKLHADVRDGVEAGKRLHDQDEKASSGQVLTRGANAEEYTFATPHGSGLSDGSVGTAQLANDAVTAPKIKNLEVIADKLGPGAVTNSKLARGAVTEDKISNGQIDERVLAEDVKSRLVPDGGDEGQALIKASGTDYDTEWGNVAAEGGGGGGEGEGGTTFPVWPTHTLAYAGADLDPITFPHYSGTPSYPVVRRNLPVESDTIAVDTTANHNFTLTPGTWLINGYLRYSNDSDAGDSGNARIGARLVMFPNADAYDPQGGDTYARWGKTSNIPDNGIENHCVISAVLPVEETTTAAHFALEVENQSAAVDVKLIIWEANFRLHKVEIPTAGGDLTPHLWAHQELVGVPGTIGVTVNPPPQANPGESRQYSHKTENLPLQTSLSGTVIVDGTDATLFTVPKGNWLVKGSVTVENSSAIQSVDSKAETRLLLSDAANNVVLKGDSATLPHGKTTELPDHGLTAVNTVAGFLQVTSPTQYRYKLRVTNQSHNTLIAVSPSQIQLDLYESRGAKGDKGDKGEPGTATIADGSVTTSSLANNAVTTAKLAPGAVAFPNIDSQLVKQLLPGLGQDGEIVGQAGQVPAVVATKQIGPSGQPENIIAYRTAVVSAPFKVVDTTVAISQPLLWSALPPANDFAGEITKAAMQQGVGDFLVIGKRSGQFIHSELKRIPLMLFSQFEPVTAGQNLAASSDHYYLEIIPSNLISGNNDKIMLIGKSSDNLFVVASRAGVISLDIQVFYLSPIIGQIPQ